MGPWQPAIAADAVPPDKATTTNVVSAVAGIAADAVPPDAATTTNMASTIAASKADAVPPDAATTTNVVSAVAADAVTAVVEPLVPGEVSGQRTADDGAFPGMLGSSVGPQAASAPDVKIPWALDPRKTLRPNAVIPESFTCRDLMPFRF